MSDIETRLLRYFVAVAEEQHFARAAERLGITPQTLTPQIKKLESEVGAKLLERKGSRKVVVTEAGQRVLSLARDVLRRVEEVAPVAQQAERGELGRLHLGFMTSLSCAGLLQVWIGEFRRANPAIEITMHRLGPIAQIGGIMRKELDAGFTRALYKYPAGLRGIEVYRQRLVLALPGEHPLARRKHISPEMLRTETFVNTPPEFDVGLFGYTEAVAGIGKFTPRVVQRNDDFIALLTYVALGYGITVVPELITRMNVPNVVFRDIAGNPRPETSMAFVYRDDLSPSAKRLIKHMQRHALPHHGAGALPRIRIPL
jgi:DNA-binding transcriptional LysR family regulator